MDFTELAPELFATHSRSIPFIQMQFLHFLNASQISNIREKEQCFTLGLFYKNIQWPDPSSIISIQHTTHFRQVLAKEGLNKNA